MTNNNILFLPPHPPNVTKFQSKDKVDLELEVISTEPRAFVIKNFFSDFEVNWIVETAKPNLHGFNPSLLNSFFFIPSFIVVNSC